MPIHFSVKRPTRLKTSNMLELKTNSLSQNFKWKAKCCKELEECSAQLSKLARQNKVLLKKLDECWQNNDKKFQKGKLKDSDTKKEEKFINEINSNLKLIHDLCDAVHTQQLLMFSRAGALDTRPEYGKVESISHEMPDEEDAQDQQ